MRRNGTPVTGKFRRWLASCAAALAALSGAALATTVTDFCLEDLVEYSHAGVRVRVLSTTGLGDHVRHRMRMVDVLFGTVPGDEIDLDLLSSIEGMPALRPGDEVVVFLNFDNRIERVIGLKWGTYRIEHEQVFTHDRRAQRLTAESRGGQTVTFLRALSSDKAGSVSYEAFAARVLEVYRRSPVRRRMSADSQRPGSQEGRY